MTKTEAIVLVSNNSAELKNLSETLKNDKDVVKAAIKNRPNFDIFTVYNKKNYYEKEFRQKQLEIEFGEIFLLASDILKSDLEFCLTCARINPTILPYVDKSLWGNKNFILKSIEIAFWAIWFVPTSNLNDKEIINLYWIKKSSQRFHWRLPIEERRGDFFNGLSHRSEDFWFGKNSQKNILLQTLKMEYKNSFVLNLKGASEKKSHF